MLRVLRGQSKTLAAALLVSLLAAFVSEAAPGHASREHDAACLPEQIAPHDEADHARDRVGTSHEVQHTHCLVCHWARTFHPLGQWAAQYTTLHEWRSHVVLTTIPAPAVFLHARLIPRAPPSALSL
jgi:hypothetical protein